jgi:peptidyl-prolyl cis-trans isomerase SurA
MLFSKDLRSIARMIHMKRLHVRPVALLVSTGVLVGVVAAGVVASGAVLRAEIIEQVLVKVNGEIFTKIDLEERQVQALRQNGQQGDVNDAQLRQKLDEVTPQLLVTVIDEMLMVQRGRELGYRMGDDQFKSVLESIKKDNKIETDEQFQAALKQENMTLSDLRRNLERTMIIQRVQQNEVLGKVSVNDEEARQYYDSHLGEFTKPQTVTLREIFVSVPTDGKTVSVGLDEEAKAKADRIRERALAGESFEKLAADLSDAPSRSNAGLIGPLSLSDLSPDVRKLVASMKTGDITEVLRGTKGYQLLKLESMTTSETLPFQDAREDISNRVFTDKRKQEFDKYLQRLRSEAIIEWKNAEIRKAYELGVEQSNRAPAAASS